MRRIRRRLAVLTLSAAITLSITSEARARTEAEPGPVQPGEQLETNHVTLAFGFSGQGADGLAGTGITPHGAFSHPPGKSLRFFDGTRSQAAGTYDLALKNAQGEQLTGVVPNGAPAFGEALSGGGTFDGTALWLGHSRFRRGAAPPVGADSPPATGTRADGTAGPAELGTDVRVDNANLVPIPVVPNQVTNRSLLVSAQVYTPTHAGSRYQIRPQPYLAREGGGAQWGLTAPGGLGPHPLDLSPVLDRWALLQIRVDLTTNGGTQAGPSDDSGRATFRYFLDGTQAGPPVELEFDPNTMRNPAHTGPVLFGPAFGLTRGWQGDAPEVFLDNIALDTITGATGGAFRIASPAPGSTIAGPTALRVALGGLTGVASVEYLLNGRPMYADGELILPRRTGPSYDLGWSTANWFDGSVTVEAVARDATGRVLGRTAPTPFQIANGDTKVTHVSPDPNRTVSGSTVPWTVRTDHSIGAGQNHIWYFYVDGKEIPRRFHGGQEFTHELDTTKLRNGKHELLFVLELEDARFNPFPVLGASLVTVNVDNGHTLMELRSNYSDAFLVPNETVRLTPRRVFTDGVEEPAAAAFTSSDTTVATVDAAGTVIGRRAGFADITATHNGLTAVTRVTVRDRHDFPHFTRSGQIVGTYQADSTFMRTMFNLDASQFLDPRQPNLGQQVQQAGVNTLTTGFYLSPADGAARNFDQWKAGIDGFHKRITDVAQQNNLSIYLTGDDIARSKRELADSVCASPDPAVCAQPVSQPKLRYALDRAAGTRRVIGIDMVDEVTMLWGGTPTPTDGRWHTPPPRLEDDSFTRLMQTMNSTNRPRMTWTALGIAGADRVRNWTGNPAFSDYNGIYHDILWRPAYPAGASTFQFLEAIDRSTIGRRGAYLPNAPSVLLTGTTGPFYRKAGPGDHYVAGRDLLHRAGMHAPQVAAEVVYSLIRGMSGVRVYGFDGTLWRDHRANAAVGTTHLQTGGAPTGIGAERWRSMSDAFTLIAGMERYLLQPSTHAIDLGPNVRTGAKRGPNGNVLIALNASERTETISASLGGYATGKPITRSRLIGGVKRTTETIANAPTDTLTLEPGEAVFWVFPT